MSGPRDLRSFVTPISAAPAGVDMEHSRRAGSANKVTVNDSYLAYVAASSVFIFKISDYRLIDSICGSEKVHIILLSPVNLTHICIVRMENVVIMDFVTKAVVMNYKAHSIFYSYPFRSLAFTNDGKALILFPGNDSNRALIEIDRPEDWSSQISLELPTVRYHICHPTRSGVYITVAESGRIHVIDENKTKMTGFKNLEQRSWVTCDPLNTDAWLAVGVDPTWVMFTCTEDTLAVMSTSVKGGIEAHFGDWIPAMPGHVVTGSWTGGVLHVWSVASVNVTATIEVGEKPVTALYRSGDSCVVIAMSDGIIGIVDVVKRRYVYKLDSAHTNTVFSATIMPMDKSTLVTGGADGCVCTWELPTLKRKTRIFSSRGTALICTCVSPGGGYVAGITKKGEITLMKVKDSTVLFTHKLHSARGTSVDWSPHDRDIVVTSGLDNMCCLFNIETRQVVAKITLGAEPRKVRFSPRDKSIAIAVSDGTLSIRLDGGAYNNIPGKSNCALYAVAWSPYDTSKIVATDDDGGLNVFDIVKRTSSRAVGHDKARPVLWSHVVEWMVITGGWDGRLVFWDIRNLSQLGYVMAHASHIYGLASHPDYPTMFVSTSRDETIRVWSYDGLVKPQKARALLNEKEVVADRYSPFEGASQLRKLICRLKKDGTQVAFHEGDASHAADVSRLAKKRIAQMMSNAPTDQSTLMRSKKEKGRLLDAADIALKSGDTKRSCELLFMVGEYDKALAMAPAVSYKFWQNLTTTRAKIQKDDIDQYAACQLLTSNPKEAIKLLMKAEMFDDALLIAASMRKSTFRPRTASVSVKRREVPEFQMVRKVFDESIDFEPLRVASEISINYARAGRPLLSAVYLLAVGDVVGASWRLLHCGEIAWALEVNKCCESDDERLQMIFARYCVYNNCADDIFRTTSPLTRRKMAPFVEYATEKDREAF